MDDNYKNLIMFYQTTLRNVGLYTTISFGALGYSRFYRGKSQLYNLALILISLCFLAVAAIINYYLITDVMEFSITQEEDMKAKILKWNVIPQTVLVFQAILLLLGTYTLLSQTTQ